MNIFEDLMLVGIVSQVAHAHGQPEPMQVHFFQRKKKARIASILDTT